MNLAWVLRQILNEQTRAQVRSALAQATDPQRAAQSAEDDPDRALPQRCQVGLVFALSAESGGTVDLLSGDAMTKGQGFVAHSGTLAERHVVLLEAGAGRESAARGTQALIGGHRPDWIISAGFGGGLHPDLKRNDLVLANEVLDVSGRRLPIELETASDPAAGIHVGRLVTVDKIVRLPDEKRALGKKHQALAVDMESWAVGEVCRQAQTRFLSVRVISDSVDDELPKNLERLIQQKSTAGRLGAAAGMLLANPSSIKDMLRLKEQALVASDRLAKFLAELIPLLVPRIEESEPTQ